MESGREKGKEERREGGWEEKKRARKGGKKRRTQWVRVGGRGREGRHSQDRNREARGREMVAERDLERYSQEDMVGQRKGWRRKGK